MTLQLEKKNKTAVLSFGRHNPPTTGHEKLLNKVHSVAKQHGGTAHVVTSHSHDAHKNPVPQDKKLGYLRKVAHPDVKVSGSSKEHPTILHHASKLHAAGHKHLVVVAGADREKEFHKTLNTYNGKEGKHGHYNFKSIKVVSSGKRDPDAHGTEGISGTKMRDHARAGRHKEFKQGLPKALHPHAKEIHGHTVGGTQLESFKEALDRMRNKFDKKKKFKPTGEKTEVIMHVNPPAPAGNVKNGKPGSPAGNARAGGTRFGESRAGNVLAGTKRGSVLGFSMGEDVNAAFESIDEATDIEDKDEVALKKIVKSLKKSVKGHDKQQKKIAHLLKKDQQNEEKNCGCGQDPCITYGKEKEEVTEVLSRAGRIKRGLMMRRIKHKVQRKKAMMRKKMATVDMLSRRSRRHAVKLVRKRFMGKKGENYAKLGMSDKIMIDKRMEAKKAIIIKIAQRLLPKVRRAELIRLKNYKQNKIGSASKASSSLSISKVKQSSSEDFVMTKKDTNAIMEKVFKSDMDPNTLFEIFALGVISEGKGTPQQRGFQSLNTFIADDYNTAAALEVPDKKYKPEEAITNLALNTRNRNSTIKNYNYGPLNDSDEEFWEKAADLWDTTTEIAKESRCHNCAVFDVKPATLKKIAKVLGPDGDAIVKTANIGYCEMFAFKCAGARVCDAWVGGGPLKESMADWEGEPIQGTQLDRRFNSVVVRKSAIPKLQEFKADGERSDIEDPVDPKTVAHDIIDKDNKSRKKTSRKKIKKLSELEYPHETAKKYKKDTPGQKNESVRVANISAEVKTDAQVKKDQEDRIQGVVKNVRKDQYNLNRRIKRVTNKVLNPKTKIGGVQNEDAADQAAKELEKVRNKRLQDKMLQQIAVKKRHLAQRAAAQSRGNNVQNEDAAAMMRVKQAQTNQRDRLRQQHEREMEQMDNSDEKKKKREAFQKSMQTLKDRQMARQDTARARLPR
tara:strand:+ start:1198 stop:4068 length:2871 start_codon:yes stop_codon:yes gene_type:complete